MPRSAESAAALALLDVFIRASDELMVARPASPLSTPLALTPLFEGLNALAIVRAAPRMSIANKLVGIVIIIIWLVLLGRFGTLGYFGISFLRWSQMISNLAEQLQDGRDVILSRCFLRLAD